MLCPGRERFGWVEFIFIHGRVWLAEGRPDINRGWRRADLALQLCWPSWPFWMLVWASSWPKNGPSWPQLGPKLIRILRWMDPKEPHQSVCTAALQNIVPVQGLLGPLDACLGPQLEPKQDPTRSQVGSTFAQDGFQEPHQSVYTAALQNIVPAHVLLGSLGALGLPCCHRPPKANLRLRYFYICHKKFGAEPQNGKIKLVFHESLVQNPKRAK